MVRHGERQALAALLLIGLCQWCLAANPYAGMRDPTKPLRFVADTEGLQSLSLNSVLISEARKFAVINGKQVKEQDVINGARVISIEPGQVKLIINGREKVLVMRAPVRQPSRHRLEDPA